MTKTEKTKKQIAEEKMRLYHPHRKLKEKLTRADEAALRRAFNIIQNKVNDLFGELYPIFDFDLELNKILEEQETAIANVSNTLRAHLIKLGVVKE